MTTPDEHPVDVVASTNPEGGRRFLGVPVGRRAVAAAAVLVGGGAIAGGVLASTIGASASPGTVQLPAASSSPATPPASAPPHVRGDGPGRLAGGSTGTVTAVGTATVTIKTSTATTTYSVTSATTIFKAGTPAPDKATVGKATLADVKVGDTVFFATTTKDGTVLARLLDGKLPARGPGGPANGVKPLTGTVTAVGTSTVTIKTSTATTTYSVTSTTTIEKFAQGSLDGVKVGDTVSFETTTTGGTVLAHLMDGKPAFGGRGGPGFGGPGFGGHGFGGPPGPGGPVTPGGTTT
jgi:hypothetical protein